MHDTAKKKLYHDLQPINISGISSIRLNSQFFLLKHKTGFITLYALAEMERRQKISILLRIEMGAVARPAL